MSAYPSWCCPRCGKPIGWLGRVFGALGHNCAPAKRTVQSVQMRPASIHGHRLIVRVIDGKDYVDASAYAKLLAATQQPNESQP